MQHLAWQPLHDVADGLRVHLPAARREHEAERVGAQRDREQRVVLVGDPADLDEHVSPPAVRRPARSSSPSRRAGVGSRVRAPRRPAPHRSRRRPSARRRSALRTALSATATTSARKARRERLGDTEILGERREVAAVDADDARAGHERALDLALRRAPRRARRARGRRRARADRRALRRPVSRRRSAGSRRRRSLAVSYTWTSSIVKSLRSTGSSVTVSRAACRSATVPPKYGASVSTDSAAAPPRLVRLGGRAADRGRARASPFDGDRRLISAITATCPSARRNAARERARRRRVERAAPQQVAGLRLPQHRDLVALRREDLVEDAHAARVYGWAAPADRGSQRLDAPGASPSPTRTRTRRPAARSLAGPSRVRRIPRRS